MAVGATYAAHVRETNIATLICIKMVRHRRAADRGTACRKEPIQMTDLIMLAMGLGLFVISVGYAYACDRL